jgi:hypothetical protein
MADNGACTVDQFVPKWEPPFSTFGIATAHKNAWRVSWRHDADDVVGVAGMVFARVVHRYSGRPHPKYGLVTEPKHWMAIYRNSLYREFHTLAYETRASVEVQQEWGEEHLRREGFVQEAADGRGEGGVSRWTGVAPSEAELTTALARASEELRDVLRIVFQAPAEILSILLEPAEDEAWSRRLCRMLRINLSETIVAELREILDPQRIDLDDLDGIFTNRLRWAPPAPAGKLRKATA